MRIPLADPVIPVHGIRARAGNGRPEDWHPFVRAGLSPFYRTATVRYREFHQPVAGGGASVPGTAEVA